MSKSWIKGVSNGPHFTIQGADGSVLADTCWQGPGVGTTPFWVPYAGAYGFKPG